MLIKYIKKDKTPIGVIVAVDKNKIGLSLCNKKDKWNKKLGIQIAKGRAFKNNIQDYLNKIKNEKALNEIYKNLIIIEKLAEKYDFNRAVGS
jgi:hypothetical protein